MFLFYPSEDLWNRMLLHFNTTETLKVYQFPDRDFLAEFYWEWWCPVSWKFNALKTMRYWHRRIWSDEKLVILHYIVDKPWERRGGPGVTGHLGRDGGSHEWWWEIYHGWRLQRKEAQMSQLVLTAMHSLVDTEKPFTEQIPLPQ